MCIVGLQYPLSFGCGFRIGLINLKISLEGAGGIREDVAQ